MERVNRILRHPIFINHMREISILEESRIFCGHDIGHLIDTARTARILMQERKIELPLEEIYAAALLHDLGRVEQYNGLGHHTEISACLAERILSDCGFAASETVEIADAIRQHASDYCGSRSILGSLLFDADKKSRPCFFCKAADECNWPQEKRNTQLIL